MAYSITSQEAWQRNSDQNLFKNRSNISGIKFHIPKFLWVLVSPTMLWLFLSAWMCFCIFVVATAFSFKFPDCCLFYSPSTYQFIKAAGRQPWASHHLIVRFNQGGTNALGNSVVLLKSLIYPAFQVHYLLWSLSSHLAHHPSLAFSPHIPLHSPAQHFSITEHLKGRCS